jgi:2-polyprenyl-3-methyl-5-hydroxy-6-metoxy-1,4-benzoquinol methylase/3-polyprenyl-4-hydroxybenzoate decarboxylase
LLAIVRGGSATSPGGLPGPGRAGKLGPVSEQPWVRAAVVRVVDHGDTTIVIGPNATRKFAGDSAELVRAVLELYVIPLTRDELFAALAERADGEIPAQPVDDLLALLTDEAVLVRPRGAPAALAGHRRRVVLGISGAIAAADAPMLVRGLQAAGCEVRIALTRAAARFVSAHALEALVHHPVGRTMWHRDPEAPALHIQLAEWAELVLVCPASATTIARLATGDCSELVAATVAATRAPVVVAPSMNDAMYASPAVQHNLATLRTHGRWVVHPALGHEVAHAPEARRSLLGPAPPAAAVIDIVRHVLRTAAAQRAYLPADAAGWERLWRAVPDDQLPWHGDAPDPALDAALAAHGAPGRRLLDLGTGSGTVALAAARHGYKVTATDVAPAALGRAHQRAGELPIVFVLDDVTATRLDGTFDVAVDCGLLHVLARERWAAYAHAVTALVAPGGSLLVAAHAPGHELATQPVTRESLAALLPAFSVVQVTPITLAHSAAHLFELARA